jgi:hypothetical protein
VAVAVVLMIVAVTVTAGLGVIALLEIPVGAAVIASFLVERRIRSRRSAGGRRARHRRNGPPS